MWKKINSISELGLVLKTNNYNMISMMFKTAEIFGFGWYVDENSSVRYSEHE